jgi:predicted Zn-dependent protease
VQSITENGKLVRWARNRIPLKIFIARDKSEVYRDGYRDIFMDAIEDWSKASQDRLKFVYVKSARKADITIDWTSNAYDVRRSGSDVEQGICFTQAISGGPADGTIDKATIRILMIDPVNQKPLSDDSMKVTCLHEFGHAIGLRGHSNNNHDVMFYSVSPTVWPVLSKRDKATIARLYRDYPSLAH